MARWVNSCTCDICEASKRRDHLAIIRKSTPYVVAAVILGMVPIVYLMVLFMAEAIRVF